MTTSLAERLERISSLVKPKLIEHFGEEALEFYEHRGELSVRVSRERLHEVCAFLRDDAELRFWMLKDVHAVDCGIADTTDSS